MNVCIIYFACGLLWTFSDQKFRPESLYGNDNDDDDDDDGDDDGVGGVDYHDHIHSNMYNLYSAV